MTKSQIADKIERQLSLHDQVVLSARDWATVIDALREPTRAVSSSSREYIVPSSASHGPR